MINEERIKVYLMGVFDGDGCICPSLPKTGYIRLFVSVCMASEEVIDLFCTAWGGGKTFRPPAKNGYLGRYAWTLTGTTAIPFLQYAEKHLVVKKQQARLALLLTEEIAKSKIQKPGSRRCRGQKSISPETFTYRRELALSIKSLNGARSRYAQQ